jgi:uncharacterized membrane protein
VISRVLIAVGVVVAGTVIGITGAFVQAQRFVFTIGDLTLSLPWGTVLTVIVLGIAVRGAAWAVQARWGAWLLFLAWLAATLFMATKTASGDLAVSSGSRQLGYLIAGVVLGAGLATFPLPRGTVHRS